MAYDDASRRKNYLSGATKHGETKIKVSAKSKTRSRLKLVSRHRKAVFSITSDLLGVFLQSDKSFIRALSPPKQKFLLFNRFRRRTGSKAARHGEERTRERAPMCIDMLLMRSGARYFPLARLINDLSADGEFMRFKLTPIIS